MISDFNPGMFSSWLFNGTLFAMLWVGVLCDRLKSFFIILVSLTTSLCFIFDNILDLYMFDDE